MPNVYRAPDQDRIGVIRWISGMLPWWPGTSLALVPLSMTNNGKNTNGIFDDRVHMAELVALLGPPPPEFREQRHLSSVFWDESGKWNGVAPILDITLESLTEKVEGEDKEWFLRWLRMVLQWNPEDRPTALELLYDEWLMKGLGE